MKRVIFLYVFFAFFPAFLFASTKTDEKRKIQEEVRKSLYPTQARPGVISAPVVRQQELEKPAPSSKESYFEELFAKKYLLRSDVFRSLLILIGEDSPSLDMTARIALLKEKGIIPQELASSISWNEPLRKGLAANLFCRALGMRGGIIMRLFGIRQRYAFNELVFARIMPQGSERDIMSGEEFVILFTNATQYLSEKNETLRRKMIK